MSSAFSCSCKIARLRFGPVGAVASAALNVSADARVAAGLDTTREGSASGLEAVLPLCDWVPVENHAPRSSGKELDGEKLNCLFCPPLQKGDLIVAKWPEKSFFLADVGVVSN